MALQAQLSGKLSREQENLEDLLTSNVFGSLRYFPPSEGLIPFLARCAGEHRVDFSCDGDWEARYEFWPWLQEQNCHGCEPDVLLRLDGSSGARLLVLVEAKYRSGKSSEATPEDNGDTRSNDQLAREWENLHHLAQKEERLPLLIYLTADYSVPAAEIEDSQRELAAKKHPPGRIAWLSWRHLSEALAGCRSPILQDVRRLMRDRYGFTRFEGFGHDTLPLLPWAFVANVPSSPASPMTFSWDAPTQPMWRFER